MADSAATRLLGKAMSDTKSFSTSSMTQSDFTSDNDSFCLGDNPSTKEGKLSDEVQSIVNALASLEAAENALFRCCSVSCVKKGKPSVINAPRSHIIGGQIGNKVKTFVSEEELSKDKDNMVVDTAQESQITSEIPTIVASSSSPQTEGVLSDEVMIIVKALASVQAAEDALWKLTARTT